MRLAVSPPRRLAIVLATVVLALLLDLIAGPGSRVAAAASDEVSITRGISLVGAQEYRIALVVGNAAYGYAPLGNPVNDARAMTKTLKQLGFEVIHLEDAKHRELQTAILEFGERLADGGTGLFYYAGHGIQVRGTNYLVPTDESITSEASVRFEAIALDAVLEQMGQPRPNRTNIVILDACRNNPFATRYGGSGAGLALVDAPTDFLVAYAASPGGVAIDGNGENGVYTGELLRAMTVPGLRIEDVFKRTRAAVSRQTGQAQIPWEASSMIRDFSFASETPVPATAEVVAEAPAAEQTTTTRDARPDQAFELAFWDTIKDSTDPADFEAYLISFPEGAFAPLAQARIARYQSKMGGDSAQGAPEVEVAQSAKVATPEPAATAEPEPEPETQVQATEQTVAALAPDPEPKTEPEPKTAPEPVTETAPEPKIEPAAEPAPEQNLETLAALATGPKVEEMDEIFIAKTTANLRDAPSASGRRTGRLKKGATLLVTGELDGWYRLITGSGKTAYVFGELVEPLAQDPASKQATQPAPEPPAQQAALPKAPEPVPQATASDNLQPAVGIFPAPAAGVFQDCEGCPEMVPLPAGAFRMGTSGGDLAERPAHRVTLAKPFAIGRFEVSVGEWRLCVSEGACDLHPKLAAAGDLEPVRYVSHGDATSYISWLRKKTGRSYRFPSEAEWEYAARGGTTTAYWWGDKVGDGRANCKDCGGPYDRKRPRTPGQYAANPFGLHDMSGGVAEWVADCWLDNYEGAASDGKARVGADCRQRVLRGGSWRNGAASLRSAARHFYDANVAYSGNGFRVALTLN